ncbi:hypothetical protein Tco_0408115 [Tanacetum coccineum]
MQKNRIFRISVDILHNTNFFSAFTASTDVPSIYIQQFWNTLGKDSKTGVYSFQLDELWFNLNVDLLRKALGITPKDSAHPFVPPPAGDLTFGGDRPRHLVLQMLWDIVTGTNVDYAKLIWEEFVYAIKNFFFDAANLKVPTKKPKPHVILYCRFTKFIIYYLGSRNNIHRRPQSPVHITIDDYPLGNLKFFSKGGVNEKYLGMAACKPRQPTTVIDEDGGKKKKALEAGLTTLLMKKMKKVNLLLNLKWKMMNAISKERRSLVTLDASAGPSTQPKDDTSANVVHDTSSPANSINDAETGVDTKKSTSKADIEILYVEEEHGEQVSNTVDLEERIVELDEGLAGSDPGKTLESRPPPERVLIEEDQAGSNPRQSHVAQAGPNPEPMHKDFIATVYPHVHESLKLTTEEEVHIENPPSSSGTLSSMKNLEDAFTFGDQFLNDKSTKEVLGKANVETEVESMVIVPIHQASSSIPLLSNPIINLSPPKPVVYKLEHHDLYSKIDKQVSEVVKEVVHNALQAPLCERFKDLSKFQMKKIFHDWMFESNSYRSNPDHTTLSKALEASMQRDNNDELHEELTKYRKRRRDDQDPPLPPPKDSDQSKNKKHDLWIVVTLD